MFRKGKRTTDHLVEEVHLSMFCKANQHTVGLFLDLQKATNSFY